MARCSDPDCKKLATQYHPGYFCDYHWERRYGTQFAPYVAEELKLDSPHVPFGLYLNSLNFSVVRIVSKKSKELNSVLDII